MKTLINKISIIVILFSLSFLSLTLVSCKNNKCKNHLDENKDFICDQCGEKMPLCDIHIDTNHDLICDECGFELLECIEHLDENKDFKCDVCGKKIPTCEVHTDVDEDYQCDVCGTYLPYPEISLEEIYDALDKMIPEVIEENINLPNLVEGSTASIYWSSSNEDVLNYRGIVKRGYEDQVVTLTANICYDNGDRYSHEIITIVRGMNLKPLENKKIVMAYYYGDSGITSINEESLKDIDYINYSFGSIVSGKVVVHSSLALKKALSYRNQGVRVGLAIGGWGADGFSQAVATPDSRTKFADSIIDVMKEYGFDGIDIDWEYPTSSAAGIASSPNDKANLTLFCEELSRKIKNYREDAILTMAVVASSYFDFIGLEPYVDYFNLMAYDYSIGSNIALHHANLYTSNYSLTNTSLDVNVKRLINLGVPCEKIIVGAAFYGRWASFSSAQNTTIGSMLSTTLSSTMSYTKIKEQIDAGNYVESWDDVAKAPYIIKLNNQSGIFITYENSRSVGCKCEYVLQNNLGGIMFWELSQDQTGDLVLTMGTYFNNEK